MIYYVILLLTLVQFQVNMCLSILFLNDHHQNSSDRYVPFLTRILENSNIPKHCTLVMSHTSREDKSISAPFYTTLTRPWLEITLPTDFDTELKDEDIRFPQPWPAPNPEAPSTGTCAVHVLFFKKGLLDRLLQFIPMVVAMPLQRDYFVLLNLDFEEVRFDEVEELLLNSSFVSSLKYKIMPMLMRNGNMKIYFACFYCDGGNPKVLKAELKEDWHTDGTELVMEDFTRNLNNSMMRIIFDREYSEDEVRKFLATGNCHNNYICYLFLIISEFLKCKFQIVRSKYGESGVSVKQNDNGTWVGYADDILSGVADVTGSSLFHEKLSTYLDQTGPTIVTGFDFLLSNPVAYYTPWAIVTPFGVYMWLCLLVSVFLTAIFYATLLKKLETQNFYSEMSAFQTYVYSVFYLYFSMLGLGSPSMPIASSIRAFLSCWLFFGILITFFYQSTMTSLMTVPSRETQPKTYKEAFDMKYQFISHGQPGAYFQFLLKDTELDYLILIRDNLDTTYGTATDCIQAIIANRKMTCVEPPALYIDPLNNFLDDKYQRVTYAVTSDRNLIVCVSYFKKNYLPATTFSFGLRLFLEHGFVEKYEKQMAPNWFFIKALTQKRNELKNKNYNYPNGEIPLKINHLQGAYLVLIFGIVIACLVFIVEKCSCL